MICIWMLTFNKTKLKRQIMIDLHPQYITDTAGKKLVVLPLNEFNNLLEELEELDDIRVYDEAKNEDDGERILFSDYVKARENNG